MKSKSLSAAAIVFLTPVLMFAASKNSANVELDQSVKVADTQLAPGQYKVIWQGSGPDITVSFKENGKTVATVPAKLVSNTSTEEAIETHTVPNATAALKAIDLKHFTIKFGNAAPATGN